MTWKKPEKVKRGIATARSTTNTYSILNQFEEDVFRFEERLSQKSNEEKEERGDLDEEDFDFE